jgi:flagellar M-ring protein FliF
MELNALMKKGLWFAAALLAAATVAALAWLFSGHKVVLFEGLSSESLVEYSAKLEEKGLAYQVDASNGSIMVDVADANQARVLALGDRVRQNSQTGLELYGNTDFNATEYAHQANYTRALQGEIERTLSAIHYIKAARVHLSLPAKKLFGPSQTAKASVTLFLADHYQPAAAQIQGIRQIVASAVEGLTEAEVVVLSSEGQFSDQQTGTMPHPVLSLQKATEQYLAEKVYQVLSPVLSAQQVSVSVLAELAADKVRMEETRPATASQAEALIAKESSQQESKPATGSAAQGQSERREVSYLHGTVTTQTELAQGQVKRLSVAVSINAQLDQASHSQIESLIAATVGMDARRGDQLSVRFFQLQKAAPDPAVIATSVASPAAAMPDNAVTAPAPQAAVSEFNWPQTLVVLALVLLLVMLSRWWWLQRQRHDQRLVNQIQELFRHDAG